MNTKARWCMEKYTDRGAVTSEVQGSLDDLAILLPDAMEDQVFALVVYRALAIHARRQAEAIARWTTRG